MPLRAIPRPRPFAAAIHELAALRDVACLLDHDGVVLFVNDAWERFAAANGGAARCSAAALVGTRWLDGIHGEEPRALHAELLARALRRPGSPVVHTGECNDERTARLATTTLRAVVASPGVVAGVAVVQRVVRELPIGEVFPVVEAAEPAFRDAAGEVEQCACCRRSRRPLAPDEWEFVPSLVSLPPAATRFGYCALCRELHCGDALPAAISAPDAV